MSAFSIQPLSPRAGRLFISFLTFVLWLLAAVTAHAAGEPTGSMTRSRASHAAALLADGRVLVIGGETGVSSRYKTATVDIYDPATGTFATAAPLSQVRSGHAAVTLADGRVLVVGGSGLVNGASTPLAATEIYDPATATWSAGATMITARRSPTALRLADGRVLVIASDTTDASCEIFDPASGTFTPTGSLLTPRQKFAAAVLQDGRVLVVGGMPPTTGSFFSSAEIWDPASGLWTAAGAMATPRAGATATTLADGRVLVAGGTADGSFLTAVAVAELYDPVAGTFSATGALNVPRASHGAALMGDGNVVAINGISGLTAARDYSVERFDVATGTWRYVGLMPTPRAYPSATVLANGKVLVAGGDEGGVPVAAAEIVDPVCVSVPPSITPSTVSFTSAGGSGSVSVTHLPGCYWNVTRLTSWLTITSGSSGRGNGTVAYTVAEQTASSGRSITPLIADNPFSISQSGNPCANTTITPTSQSFTASGGSASVTVTTSPTCNWTVTGVPSWVTMTSGGTGSATVSYSVAANTGSARSATIMVAGRSYVVSQDAGTTGGSCGFVASAAPGGTYSGTLATTDCTGGARGTSYYTDRYSFTASPGQQVAFFLSSSAFDTYMYLRNPAGTVIASNDDGGGGTNSRIPASSGVFTLPAGTSGTYVIEVTSYSARATGAYTLQRIQ